MRPDPAHRAPHPALRGLVTAYHGYRHTGLAPGLHHGLPSTELTVVIALDEPLDVAWLHDDGSRGRHWAMLSGLHVEPAAIRHAGRQHGVQLGLTPAGARALLGLPAGAVVATLLPLGELLGPSADALYDDVAGAPTWAERFDALDRHLLAALHGRPAPSPAAPEVVRAWELLLAARGRIRVGALAEEVGWSRRHLTERLTREIGLGPKQVARVVRFQHARALLRSLPPADAALAAGYADQAHLNREWRELAGCTPTAWRREELAFVQDGAVPAGPS